MPEHPAPRWLPFAVAGLLAVFVTLATLSMLSDSQTSDEAIHLAAGYAHITRADFAINPEHPPLAKEIAALPLLLMGVSLPLDDPSWSAAHSSAFQLPLGERFLHHNGVAFTTLLSAGRAPIILLGAAVCLTVFLFARSLFGWRAALLSLTLSALCPNLLAHSRLVTTDLAVSLFLLVTLLFLHRYLESGAARDLLLAGSAAGLTLASKYSAVIVLPAILIVLLVGRHDNVLRAFATMTAVAVATLSATYAFVGLPTYFQGLASVLTTVTGGTEAYLLGSYSQKGWWYYYPVALLLKTPIPALALFATVPLSYTGRWSTARWRDHATLLVPLGLFAIASMAAARNVGLRHVLPLYPMLYVLAGQTLSLFARWRAGAALLGALAVWYTGAAVWIHPSYLAYFNELGGGPTNASRLLTDSNVDWGQDLIRLKRFMDEQGVDEILLGYYGNQDPAYYGISWQYLPSVGHIKPPPAHTVGGDRVLMAVSVMTLQGMFLGDQGLYGWLQDRQPMASVGYSIVVHDITSDRDAFERLADMYARNRLMRQAEWARDRARRLARNGLTQPVK